MDTKTDDAIATEADLQSLYGAIDAALTRMGDDVREAVNPFRLAFRGHRTSDTGPTRTAHYQTALAEFRKAKTAMERLRDDHRPATDDDSAAAASQAGEYPPHPAAALFPMMSGADLNALADDIKTNGQREPIVVSEGRMVDGRNRKAACLIAGVEPSYREWEGEGSQVSWILSVNLRRRHLTDQQRAMVAARAKEAFAAEAEERRLANLLPNKGSTESANWRSREPGLGKAAAAAAAQLGVSTRAVERAAAVIERGDSALLEAVTAGAVSLGAASTIAQLPAKSSGRSWRPER